ncbi:MAG: GNAT family N-acetyltransferase [Deltaproteobacteria bacterium]|nr:GNAT family N-acetyltransferase [Deltaproteobacteria bacterium]
MQEWFRNGFTVSTDRAKLDVDAIHAFLSSSYWAAGIPRATMERSLEGSVCFGVYQTSAGGRLVGFARVVTDHATFAYLADVFVVESHRGRGLSKWLIECVLACDELQGLRRWMLATRDAQGLYARFGFTPPDEPGRLMQRVDREIYARKT